MGGFICIDTASSSKFLKFRNWNSPIFSYLDWELWMYVVYGSAWKWGRLYIFSVDHKKWYPNNKTYFLFCELIRYATRNVGNSSGNAWKLKIWCMASLIKKRKIRQRKRVVRLERGCYFRSGLEKVCILDFAGHVFYLSYSSLPLIAKAAIDNSK